jgi:short-subunit dehydrogenase
MAYALVTGASKGIGRAIAFELALHGFDLLLAARSEALLLQTAEEIKGRYRVQVKTFPVDLSARNAAEKLAAWCSQHDISVNALVNNAGYGLWGLFENIPLAEEQNMMQLNMNAMVELSHFFIPLLKKHKPAYILNVSSTTAFQAVPAMSVYAASKAFVITFTRGLQYELRGSGIKVSCLIPGTTDTSFIDRARMEPLREIARKFEMKPEIVARAAVQGMLKGTLEIIPGFSNKASAVGTKFLPKRVAENIAASIYLKRLHKS